MSVVVRLPGPLRDLAEGRPAVELDGAGTVREALRALRRRYPALHDRIVDEQGEVRQHINVFVGSDNIRVRDGLDTPVPPDREIVILPSVSGG